MKLKIVGIGILSLIISCKTYTIPVDSFREQMINVKSENMTKVEINNPILFGNIRYFSNNIERLIVTDKHGNKGYLENSPTIEMRVTDSDGVKYHFYFDTVTLENDTLEGGRSRFMPSLTRKISISSIVKIEVQDGGKDFNYQNK